MSEEIPYPDEAQLARTALEHVQRIFKGNGVKADTITVTTHKISRHAMNAGTYLELKPVQAEKQMPGKIMVGQMVQSREDAAAKIDQHMVAAARDPAIAAQIANVLLSRPDQGFGLNQQAIQLDFLRREFTWHEGCQTCHGTSNAPCQKCQGRKLETCIKCTGRGLMQCPMCRATGLLQGQKCPKCFGQRYMPCDQCQRSGMMRCRLCNGLGVMKCPQCAGQGWKSHVMTVSAQAVTYFEYDIKTIPKGAADMLETYGPQLVTGGRVKIRSRVADQKENVLGANYEVEFPYGEIIFAVGKGEAKAQLFGYKADMLDFPFMLDKVIGPSVHGLQDAANDIGSVAEKIRKATRYRLIAQAFLSAAKTTPKKTAAMLLKTYDIGLSQGMAEKVALLAETTTSHITRKPRIFGLVAGLLINAGLMYAYYMMPVRSQIAAYLPTPKADIVLDLIALGIGGFITTIVIQITGAGAIRKALGHLIKEGQKNTLMPRSGQLGLIGYAGTLVIMLVLMELASDGQMTAPYWYEILRTKLLTFF